MVYNQLKENLNTLLIKERQIEIKKASLDSEFNTLTKEIEYLKQDIIKKHANIKELDVQQSLPGIKQTVKADYAKIGPDYGKLAPKIIAKIAIESPETILSHIEKEEKFVIDIDGAKVNVVKEYLIVERKVPEPYQEAGFKSGFLYLNKELTPELEAEGFAREAMRRIQSMRKDAGLEKKDRIELFIKADNELKEKLQKFEGQLIEKVGAKNLTISASSTLHTALPQMYRYCEYFSVSFLKLMAPPRHFLQQNPMKHPA